MTAAVRKPLAATDDNSTTGLAIVPQHLAPGTECAQ
jgi:hypothetical protein